MPPIARSAARVTAPVHVAMPLGRLGSGAEPPSSKTDAPSASQTTQAMVGAPIDASAAAAGLGGLGGLVEGGRIRVVGSGTAIYEVRLSGGVYSCSCTAWKMQRVPPHSRTCKHILTLRGLAPATKTVPSSTRRTPTQTAPTVGHPAHPMPSGVTLGATPLRNPPQVDPTVRQPAHPVGSGVTLVETTPTNRPHAAPTVRQSAQPVGSGVALAATVPAKPLPSTPHVDQKTSGTGQISNPAAVGRPAVAAAAAAEEVAASVERVVVLDRKGLGSGSSGKPASGAAAPEVVVPGLLLAERWAIGAESPAGWWISEKLDG